ncbi:PR domain zinc finger protein 15-like [Penaeus monodon]|uniref:PR domain zinc finger protein 15-like n=1 Tax=Penaeus monodon TaxID=6687 RepID=UPI0018A70E40|nr:PR domain zinc finger protein 15-like [Penaeus monodon]
MAELHDMTCDLCGDDHLSRDCPILTRLDLTVQSIEHEEPHLAFKSLPSWVRVEGGRSQGFRLVVVGQAVPKYTRLGPLIAPHMPTLSHYSSFPLKIYHAGGGCTYLDLTRKHLCNWLSLIPAGSPTNRNLLACQIDDLLYYIAAEDISEGSELRVWYTPFYQEKMKEELKSLGYNRSLVGSAVVVRKSAVSHHMSHLTPALQVSPSLSKIVVGKGQVTFTHSAGGKGYETGLQSKPVLLSGDFVVAAPSYNVPWVREGQMLKPKLGLQGESNSLTDQRRGRLDANGPKPILGTAEVFTKPSIELVTEKNDTHLKERIVTFTITAASPIPRIKQRHKEGNLQAPAQRIPREVDSKPPANMNNSISILPGALTGRKIANKHKEVKADVPLANSHIVKQLPPRALGARDPQPWACAYCGENYSKIIPLAKHLKAHLLWLVGRCHICQTCGCSFSSSQLLERHCQTTHKDYNGKALSDGRANGEVAVKFEVLSDEESVVDDPCAVGSKEKAVNEVTAIPTEPVDRPHDCQICRKHFHKAEYLLRHLRKHTGDFTCQHCLKVFARKEGLQKHNCPDEAKERNFQCSLCSKEFINPVLLQQHYLKHNGNRKCDRCRRTFANSGELDRHLKSCPSVEVTTFFQCGVCGKDFVNQTILDRHMAGHNRQYQCDICSKPYRSSTKLAQHVPLCRQSQQLASTGQVTCEDCGVVFTDATEFRSHYHTHTHPYHCSCCGHRFRSRVGYEVHVCEVEQQCDQCNMVFRSVQALNRHAAVHGPAPYACSSCRRSYYRKESLDRHVCSVEMDVKESTKLKDGPNFTCTVCGAALATKHSLNTHLRTAHGGPTAKSLSCEVCGKQFLRKDLLREHQSVHAPPSYPCPTCKKLFKTRKYLEVHSLMHQGIKRFSCKYCNKKFHQKVNLSRHERSHMPRGAVKCQYCGAHCLSTSDLKEHLLSHTLPPDVSPEDQEHVEEGSFAAAKAPVHPKELQTLQGSQPEREDAGGEIGAELLSHTPLGPDLKILSRTKDGLQTEQRTFSGPTSVIDAEQTLSTAPKVVELAVKERLDPGIGTDFKTSHVLGSELRAELVHQVVPVMASGLAIQGGSAPGRQVDKHSVLVPQTLSNLSLASSDQSFASNYILPSESTSSSSVVAAPSNLCNTGVFSAPGGSLNSDVCRLPHSVLLEPARLVPVAETPHTYHLSTKEGGQRAEERGGSNIHFAPSQLAAMETEASKPDPPQALHCHMLSGDDVVQRVMLVTDPPVSEC